MSDSQQYFRRKEAAAYARISLTTLKKWIKVGLPVHRPGGIPLIARDDLDTFIRQNGVGDTAATTPSTTPSNRTTRTIVEFRR